MEYAGAVLCLNRYYSRPFGPRTVTRFAMHTKCGLPHFGAVKLGFCSAKHLAGLRVRE